MTANPLLLQERHDFIEQQLLLEGRVLALDLARQLKVSEDTIRRDLRDLAAAGLCQRVYGGALRLPAAPQTGTMTERASQRPDDKLLLAQAAVALVRAGQVLFIDAGSTNLAIARALPDLPLTVITNAPAIAALVIDRPAIELIVIGGRVDARSGACLGASALRDVALLRPDIFFAGACGVDAQAGVSAFQFDEAEFKRQVAAVSKAVLVAATADKLGTAAPYQVLSCAQLTYLVIGHDADVVQADAFAAVEVRVVRAAAPGPRRPQSFT